MKLPKYYWWIGAVAVILVVVILRSGESAHAREDMIGYVICVAAGLIFIIKMVRDFSRQ